MNSLGGLFFATAGPLPIGASPTDMQSIPSFDPSLENPFTCEYDGCAYTCRVASNLRRHRWIHTGEKPFTCNYEGCTFATNDASNLKIHRRTHTGEKPFKCDFPDCSYATSHSSHLTRHKKTHRKNKSRDNHSFGCNGKDIKAEARAKVFECEYGCGYKCARMSTLKTHQRVHTGETPYHCSWEGCAYSSKFLSNFRRHQRKHKGSTEGQAATTASTNNARSPPVLMTTAPAVPLRVSYPPAKSPSVPPFSFPSVGSAFSPTGRDSERGSSVDTVASVETLCSSATDTLAYFGSDDTASMDSEDAKRFANDFKPTCQQPPHFMMGSSPSDHLRAADIKAEGLSEFGFDIGGSSMDLGASNFVDTTMLWFGPSNKLTGPPSYPMGALPSSASLGPGLWDLNFH